MKNERNQNKNKSTFIPLALNSLPEKSKIAISHHINLKLLFTWVKCIYNKYLVNWYLWVDICLKNFSYMEVIEEHALTKEPVN